ncbi:hypothetical protein CHARACLAT_020157 [Characodon lateralis]|uniref:Uncharacterized protein n=1 Tax=Characodon lateralis TaxID=208331 RepID=A0ABU7EV74_9TELE|nr:hypothetical protein [Characodon lateralis]
MMEQEVYVSAVWGLDSLSLPSFLSCVSSSSSSPSSSSSSSSVCCSSSSLVIISKSFPLLCCEPSSSRRSLSVSEWRSPVPSCFASLLSSSSSSSSSSASFFSLSDFSSLREVLLSFSSVLSKHLLSLVRGPLYS